jgi:hypothetical protein
MNEHEAYSVVVGMKGGEVGHIVVLGDAIPGGGVLNLSIFRQNSTIDVSNVESEWSVICAGDSAEPAQAIETQMKSKYGSLDDVRIRRLE